MATYGLVNVGVNDFRLTPTTGVPVQTTDVLAVATLYSAPYIGKRVVLYDVASSLWITRFTDEISIALAAIVDTKIYDVFEYWTGAAVALELSAAWASDTARTDAVSRLDGVLTKTADRSRRLVGTIRATAAGQIEFSAAKRMICNVSNRVLTAMDKRNVTANNYNANAWRYFNNDATYQIEFVMSEQSGSLYYNCGVSAQHSVGGVYGLFGAGLNAAAPAPPTSYPTQIDMPRINDPNTTSAVEVEPARVGWNFISGLQNGRGIGGTIQWNEMALHAALNM